MKKKLSILAMSLVGVGCLSSCGVPKDIAGPHEFGDYKMVSKLKDGQRYLLGFYNPGEDYLRFVSGLEHTDSNGVYPWYMATVAGTTEGAAEIEISFTDKTHFTMKVITENDAWKNRYIGVYPATSSYNTHVYSIHAGAFVGEQFEGHEVFYEFEWLKKYDDVNIYSAVAVFEDSEVDVEPTPKMFGCGFDEYNGVEYISMDCSSAGEAISESYHIAHFWEKK